ncbi:MAG: hypothetical protein AB7K09_15695 [Planctomycetota bacterium]
MKQRVIANLDAEYHLAQLLRGDATPATLSAAARHRMAVVGSLLRVLAYDDESHLWLPGELAPCRMVDVPRLPLPRVECGGELAARPPADRETWWAAINPIAARANHRGTCLALSRELGVALPGSALATTDDELRDALAAFAPDTPVVVKAVFSAAGRDRAIGPASTVADDAGRLLAAHREVIVEPWMATRTHDVGALMDIGDRGSVLLGTHQIEVDPRGRFVGITLADVRNPDDPAGLTPDHHTQLLDTVRAVAAHLRALGYRGVAGVDAWVYTTADDATPRLHPLGEINARMTFGHVARKLAERLQLKGRVTLHLSGSASAAPAAGATTIPLVVDADNKPVVWLTHSPDTR